MISHGYTLVDSVVVRRKEKKSPARSILDRGELRYLMSLNAWPSWSCMADAGMDDASEAIGQTSPAEEEKTAAAFKAAPARESTHARARVRFVSYGWREWPPCSFMRQAGEPDKHSTQRHLRLLKTILTARRQNSLKSPNNLPFAWPC